MSSALRSASLPVAPVLAEFIPQPRRRVSQAHRVLYFAPKECWPPDTGAKLRNYHLAREIAEQASLTYLGFSDPGSSVVSSHREIARGIVPGSREELGAICSRVVTVPRKPGYSLYDLVRGAVGPVPVSVLNYTTREMASELEALLGARDYDLVQVEGIHLSAYVPAIAAAPNRPPIICDWHNVESELMARYSQHAEGLARRIYARVTERRLRALERQVMDQFDAHIVVSARDRSRLLELKPDARVEVIENGVDPEHFSPRSVGEAYLASTLARSQREGAVSNISVRLRRGGRRILFVGSMDYHANIDAATYFAHKIWPSIRDIGRSLSLTIVGRNPAPEVRALASLPGVEVTGTVEDVRPHYHDAAAVVVPLRIGGGSRLKILEAMAAGVPVVSSTLGAEGLELIPGEEIIIADAGQEWREAILALVNGSDLRERVVQSARIRVVLKYSWKALGAKLAYLHASLVEERFAERRPVSLAEWDWGQDVRPV